MFNVVISSGLVFDGPFYERSDAQTVADQLIANGRTSARVERVSL